MSRIVGLEVRIIQDSRREKTIEVSLQLENNIKGTASVPQGKSRGKFEIVSLEPLKAVQKINGIVYPALVGKTFNYQEELDEFLLSIDGTFSKTNLGANTMLVISLAYARAIAAERKIPLWQYLRDLTGKTEIKKQPRLLVNIIGGGLHAQNNLDFQEYLIIPKTENASEALEISKKIYTSVWNYFKEKLENIPLGDEGNLAPNFNNNEEPFLIMQEIINNLGLKEKVDFGLDAAATHFKLLPEQLMTQYENLKKKYNLFYLEDPFGEDDFDNFAKILMKMGKDTLIVGDDLTTTNVTRIEIAYRQKSINGIIIKPNQIGTLTETINAIKKAQEYGWAVIISHRSGETKDDFIADLAYAVGADGLKAGAPFAPERAIKYQRLIEIENAEI